MGAFLSKQMERRKAISTQKKLLCDLKEKDSTDFPGCDYCPDDRKNWMSTLALDKLHVNMIVWPGTHDSATNKIGIPFISRPFARTQSLSIYKQLVTLNYALISLRSMILCDYGLHFYLLNYIFDRQWAPEFLTLEFKKMVASVMVS